MADHTLTVKPEAKEPWTDASRRNGKALQSYVKKTQSGAKDDGLAEAEAAMKWVAENFVSLWD